MGDFSKIKQYIIGESNTEQMVYQYLDDATRVYLSQYETGNYDEAEHLKLNILRKKIMSSIKIVNPVELADLYSQLMSSNLPRLKKVEDFDKDAKEADFAVWKADAHAFMDIIGVVGDRRYDYKSASFVEDDRMVIENPIDMIEEVADFATHNNRIKRTAMQERVLSHTIQEMEDTIDASIADMTGEELEQFKGQMLLKKVAYDNALSKHTYAAEYCNYFDLSFVSPLIRPEVNLLLSLQKEYSTDMVRKYSDRRYGLVPFVENIDNNIDCAILGV